MNAEPITVTELDAATQAELQPPCDDVTIRPTCSATAEWAYRLVCACGHTGNWLLCTSHKASVDWNLERMTCGGCGYRGVPLRAFAEPLR